MTDTLGTRLRRHRNARKLRQQDVAEAVGISRNYLSELEGDKTPVSRHVLANLARFFEVSIDTLYLGATSVEHDPQLVQDGDERALLALWRALDHAQKRTALSILTVFADQVRNAE